MCSVYTHLLEAVSTLGQYSQTGATRLAILRAPLSLLHWALSIPSTGPLLAVPLPKESSSNLPSGLRENPAAIPNQRHLCSPTLIFQPTLWLYLPSLQIHPSLVSSPSFVQDGVISRLKGSLWTRLLGTVSRAMQLAGLQNWLLAQPAQELVPQGIAAELPPSLSPFLSPMPLF